jgi:hypothetical protein
MLSCTSLASIDDIQYLVTKVQNILNIFIRDLGGKFERIDINRDIKRFTNPLSDNVPRCALVYYFTLCNGRQFYSSGGERCHSMG